MKVTVKQIAPLYQVLNGAKMSKMDGADQVKLVKIVRKLKCVMEPFQDFAKDAAEKLKGEEHEEMMKQAQQWQEQGEKCALTHDERVKLNSYFKEYQEKQNEALKEEAEKEHELEFEKLSDTAFEKLVASNEWTVGMAIDLSDLIAG